MEHRLKELSRNSTGELSILCARLFPWCRVLTRLGYVPWRIDKSSSANDQKLAFRKTKLRISLFWLHLMENILFRITVLATFYFPFFFLFSFSSDIFQRQFQIRFSSLKEFYDTSSSDSKKASKNVQTWFALLISLIKYLYIFSQAFFWKWRNDRIFKQDIEHLFIRLPFADINSKYIATNLHRYWIK